MKMHIVSHNLQGLCGVDRISNVHQFIRDLSPQMDIFGGQLHHLHLGRLQMLLYQLWKEADLFFSLAIDGVMASQDPAVDLGEVGCWWWWGHG